MEQQPKKDNPPSLHPIVRPLVEYERRYSLVIGDEGNYDTIELRKNTECVDHWRIKLNLKRWRNSADLASYLRMAAQVIEQARGSNAPDQRRETSPG